MTLTIHNLCPGVFLNLFGKQNKTMKASLVLFVFFQFICNHSMKENKKAEGGVLFLVNLRDL